MVVPPRWILASAAEPQVDQCHPSLCPLANFCTLVSRYGAGKHFNTSVSLIVFHLIPAAYLLYWICWRFVHSYKQAIQGKLKIERQMTPLYATWMQVLCATRVTQLLLVVFAPVDPIASTLLDVTHVFTLFFLVLALIAFLYMSDFSDWRRVTAILMGVGLLALLFAFLWYTAMSASGSWVVYMYHPNSGWGGILFMGSAFVVTSLYLIFCCIPAFQEYAPRKAIRPFLILMVNTFAFSTILYIFIYIHYELTYCLWLLHELTNVLAFPWVYVWTLYSDSNYWHTRATQTPTDCEATPLLSRSIGEEWTISPSDLTLGPLLGKGSYGEVRRGTWHGIDVAVKTIYNVHFDKSRREEFTREVEILRRLHHPHIVLFLGAYAEPDFIIMTEYMERGNLYHVLHSDTPLTFSMKLQMIQHIARGMTYLHSHRLVHRDLKSMNILVARDFTLKVSDFGLSKVLLGDGKTLTSIGSPVWSAPEIFNAKTYTEKADIYSFGIVIWEILTRKEPFEHATIYEVIKWVSEGQRPELPTAEECPSAALLALLQECWAGDEQDRPSFPQILKRVNRILAKHASPSPSLSPSPSPYPSPSASFYSLDELSEGSSSLSDNDS